MTRVAIVGASGYTALELIKILLRHPFAEITAAASRDAEHPTLAKLHPSLTGRIDLKCEPFEPNQLAERVDVAFLALPHKAAQEAAAPLLQRGVRVVDLSADYRLKDAQVYEKYYGEPHRDPANLDHAVYGLPELFRDSIRAARLVANPGCYPTGATLALAPFLARKVIEPLGIIIDSKSGVSGAGRTPKLTTHFPECNESVSAYGVANTHRHTPEIEQNLRAAAGAPVGIVFTPHLIPMDRGIFTTAYARLQTTATETDLIQLAREFFAHEPFVRVVDHLPATKDVAGSNFCDVTVRRTGDTLIAFSVIDNLIKGASGAAVQNFNLLFGYPEETGLI